MGKKEYPLKKRVLLVLLAAVLLLSVFACADTNSEKDATDGAVTVPVTSEQVEEDSLNESEPDTSEFEQTEYPLVFTDSYGNVAEIDAEPERIISCAPNVTELIFALDRGDRIVGRTDFCDYPASVSDIPSVGAIDMPDIETIIALEPDIVLASSVFTEEAFIRLSDLGISVIVLHQEYDVDGVQDMIRSVGQILNQNDLADQLTEEMKTTIEEVQNRVEEMERPSIYYVVSFGEYGDYTAGGDTFVHQLIESAGGQNIAESVSGWSYSLEMLIEEDPDIILINEYLIDSFLEAEPYNQLSAVRNGKVFGIDSNLLERQGVRNAHAVEMMAELFHPEVFNP